MLVGVGNDDMTMAIASAIQLATTTDMTGRMKKEGKRRERLVGLLLVTSLKPSRPGKDPTTDTKGEGWTLS